MANIYGDYVKWRYCSRFERKLLVEAWIFVCVARVCLLFFPFKWLASTIGESMTESDSYLGVDARIRARMISRAIGTAASRTPWKTVCLPRAIAAQWMLKRYDIAGTLYLGLAKDNTKPENFAAHAWLRCGDMILTGYSGHERFTVLSTFSSKCVKKFE